MSNKHDNPNGKRPVSYDNPTPIPVINPEDGHVYNLEPFFSMNDDFFRNPECHLEKMCQTLNMIPAMMKELNPTYHADMLNIHEALRHFREILACTRRIS